MLSPNDLNSPSSSSISWPFFTSFHILYFFSLITSPSAGSQSPQQWQRNRVQGVLKKKMHRPLPPHIYPNPRQSTPKQYSNTPGNNISNTHQHSNNPNKPPRHPRRPLCRQCRRLRLLARGRRAHSAPIPGDDLQVPVHGGKRTTARDGAAGEDPGYQEDVGYGAVFEDEERGIHFAFLLLIFFFYCFTL